VPRKIKNKKGLLKFNNRFMFIKQNWEKTNEINQITDYFTEVCRIKCHFFNNPSPIDYWNNNKKMLINSVDNNLNYKNSVFELREKIFKNIKLCSNFKITVALEILKIFKVKKWLDISSGWGDRLIASIIHGVDLYCGVDPNTCLHKYYPKIIETFDPKNADKYILIKDGFETADLPDTKFDTVFSSPPFFDVEIYSQDEHDSITTYSSGDLWYNNFLMPSIKKAYEHLESNGNFILYIAEGKTYKYINKMILDINKFMEFKGAIYYYYESAFIARRFLIWKKK
jgi:hypothetical protein